MSSAPFDVQIPATEVQIAEAIHASDTTTADTIRRLAFERDRLLSNGSACSPNGFGLCQTHSTCDHVRHALEDAQAKIRDARREQSQIVANAMAEIDPAVCRLQFPDGSIPGNAREAAEGWKRWADEFKRRAKLWERLHDERTAAIEVPNRRSFGDELVCLLNKYSKENGSNTPDFILAEYLTRCLESSDMLIRGREEWYGRAFSPGSLRHDLIACEHGVKDGDWCEPCNKEMKAAALENDPPDCAFRSPEDPRWGKP